MKYKLSYKEITPKLLIALMITGIGLFFFGYVSYLAFGDLIKQKSYDEETIAYNTTRNCDNITQKCGRTYNFTFENKEYSCNINFNSDFIENTNQVKVYFDSNNPNQCVTEHTVHWPNGIYLIVIFLLLFPFIGIFNLIKALKRVKNLSYLSKNGHLIKALPSETNPANIVLNGVQGIHIIVEHILPNGEYKKFVSKPIFDYTKQDEEKGTADLLIDPNNSEIYYIDFNIVQKY